MIYLIQTLTSTSTLRPNWLINLKILHMFNMAQDAYHVTKAMRDMGLNADLLIPILNVKPSTIDRNSTIADPAWGGPGRRAGPPQDGCDAGPTRPARAIRRTLFKLMR